MVHSYSNFRRKTSFPTNCFHIRGQFSISNCRNLSCVNLFQDHRKHSKYLKYIHQWYNGDIILRNNIRFIHSFHLIPNFNCHITSAYSCKNYCVDLTESQLMLVILHGLCTMYALVRLCFIGLYTKYFIAFLWLMLQIILLEIIQGYFAS